MNSAIGNFDGKGVRMSSEQTPVDNINVDLAYFTMLEAFYIKNGGAPVVNVESFDTPFPDIKDTPQGITINVFEYITPVEWDTLCALLSAMLANGASVFELQQRIMGLV